MIAWTTSGLLGCVLILGLYLHIIHQKFIAPSLAQVFFALVAGLALGYVLLAVAVLGWVINGYAQVFMWIGTKDWWTKPLWGKDR